jgi:nucleoside-diphosphate-sugar epimerase
VSVRRRPLGRVFVTGAGGFLGRAAVAALRADGVEVVAGDVAAGPNLPPGTLPCDVTDRDEVEAFLSAGGGSVDTVLHCGAVSGPMVLADRPDLVWRINATGTANLLEAARRRGAGRVVLCSTVEVYGTRPGIADETTMPAPPTVYGASKAAAEQAVLGYAAEHGLDACAIRLAWIYGPGRQTPTTLEGLLRAGIEGAAVRLDGHPADRTHYLHLDDAVAGLLAAALAADVGERVYNVTAGSGQTMGEVVAAARRGLADLDVAYVRDQPSGGGPDGFSGRRAGAALGYRPSIDLETGLRRTVEFIRGSRPAASRS